MPPNDDEQRTEIPPELLDPVFRLGNFYQIRTKIAGEEGSDVIFEPNVVQRKIYQAFEDHRRVIILKGRKLGVTTAVCLYMLDKVLYENNAIARSIFHRRETAGEIFSDIVQHAFSRLDKSLLLVKERASSSKELAFNNGSAYSVDTESRGKTPTILHFSEVAYFEDESKFQDSLLSLPQTGLAIFESTAAGRGNWFEREFTRNWNLLKSGKTPEIYPLFFSWFDDPTNRLPVTPETELFFPAECAEMKARFNLDDAQVHFWDRQKWALGLRLPEVFPSTAEEAFIFSTGLVYGEEFRRELNVIPAMNFSPYKLCLDYGQTNPMAVLAVHRDHDDNFVVFKEFYKSNAPLGEVRRWLELHCADKIDKNGYIDIEYPDPSTFNNTQVRDVQISPGHRMEEHRSSIADEFLKKHKVVLRRGTQNDVNVGLIRMKQYLKFDPTRSHPFRRDSRGNPIKGSPRLFVTENCQNLITEFGLYRWPDTMKGALNQSEREAPIKANDHALDALRYAVTTWTAGEGDPVLSAPPPPNTIAWHLHLQKQIDSLHQRVGGGGGEAGTSGSAY